MTFDSKEWLKDLVELMRPTEEELAMERIFKKLVSQSESNMRKVIELVSNVPPVILFGDECDIETTMADYEKWSQEIEVPYELDTGYDAWCEDQIRLSKVELLLERSN